MALNLSQQTIELQHIITKYPDPSEFSFEQAAKYYQIFVDVVSDHNHRYYIDANPIISDYEYDQLFTYLKQLEEFFPSLISNNSPTQALIAQISEGFRKAQHRIPLLSLENSYSATDIYAWGERVEKNLKNSGFSQPIFLVEPKFDGVSVELIYYQGKFVQAITRGDGQVGEDITLNVKKIDQLPLEISYKGKLHIRGEIMLSKSQFVKLNKERQERGESVFVNTRNAAAGSIKLLDSKEVAKRGLSLFVYDILFSDENCFLLELGFPLFSLPLEYRSAQTIHRVVEICESEAVKSFLDKQDFDFDGLVIKVQDQLLGEKSLRSFLGSTQHHPRWSIAYKFPAQQVITQILSLDFQVGRTGVITPVANLQPVELSGARIARVSLHNFDFIAKKDIRSGDFIRIQRSGEVIPYVVASLPERRLGQEEIISPPLMCPSCFSPVHVLEIHFYCNNPSCPAQIKEKIRHFVSRDAMDIGGIGEQLISYLVDNATLKGVDDLYYFETIEGQILLRKFPLFAEKKIGELVNQLAQSKQQPLRRLLYALGILHVGKKVAQDLANFLAEKEVKNLDQLLLAFQDQEALSGIYGIGEKVIAAIQVFFESPESLQLLRSLASKGVNFTAEKKKVSEAHNKHFSLTGSFPLPRTTLIELIESKGYFFDSSPVRGTSVMLVGNSPGSKLEKAQKLGIPCIQDWEEILERFEISLVESPSQKTSVTPPAQQSLFL